MSPSDTLGIEWQQFPAHAHTWATRADQINEYKAAIASTMGSLSDTQPPPSLSDTIYGVFDIYSVHPDAGIFNDVITQYASTANAVAFWCTGGYTETGLISSQITAAYQKYVKTESQNTQQSSRISLALNGS